MKIIHWLAYALLFVALIVLLPRTGYGPDLSSWVTWTQYIQANGLGHAYNIPDNNYHPLYLYVLWFYGKLVGNARAVDEYLYYLRLLTLPFDFAGALAAAWWLKRPEQRFAASLLLLLNVGYLYNTLIWGQVDAIYSCLVFIAFGLSVKQKSVGGFLVFLMAVNAKMQAIIFFPGLFLLWLPVWISDQKQWRAALLSGAALQMLLLAPFVRAGGWEYLERVFSVGRHAVGYYPYASLSAYNIWYLILGNERVGISDALVWCGMSYRNWGMLLFGLFSVVALVPLLLTTIRRVLVKASGLELNRLLISFALIPLAFCFFNTQMHERYWHSALLFLAAYGFVSGHYAGFIVTSFAYYLNLNNVLKAAPQFVPVSEQAVAVMFAAVIAWGIYRLYQPSRWLPRRS